MSRRLLAVLLVTLGLTGGLTLGTVTPAHAAAAVSVTGPDGAAEVPTTGGTLTITGRGFTAIKSGFGGVYVAFGWVADPSGGSWRPSRGGITGEDYRYVPDTEGRENAGRLRYVAFPGSSTAGEANGGTLSEDGTFRVELTVPGPRFTATDRAGATVDVDCTEVQCGVLTFGAHGVANADNETFTPVDFTSTVAPTAPASPSSSPTTAGSPDASSTPATPDPAPGAVPGTGDDAEITVTVDAETAVAGRVLTFTAVGLRAGEQVLVRLDDGTAVAGPFTAGAGGDVAGMLELPATLAAGTHQLHLTAAASGRTATINFAVRTDGPAEAAVEPTAADSTDGGDIAGWIFLGASGTVLVGVLVWRLAALRRTRTRRTLA